MRPVLLAQLPFPSTRNPQPALASYYRDYSSKFASAIPEYFVPEGSLWELPLWIVHLAGMLKRVGRPAMFLDLSDEVPHADVCAARILEATEPESLVMLSPLAQNFDLALQVSSAIMRERRRTVMGGNMAPLASLEDATVVYRGLLDIGELGRVLHQAERTPVLVDMASPVRSEVSWTPDYSILGGRYRRLPQLRLNASHGCLFACAFCGDAWSRKLHVVDRAALEAEVRELESLFPETTLIYVGDKTFGQCQDAVNNLVGVFRSRSQYRFVVQSHIRQIDPRLIETMRALGVVVIELGFETADSDLLRRSHKGTVDELSYDSRLDALRAAGIKIILNVLGGLPHETAQSHALTVDRMKSWTDQVWLYNLYNFVPYPLTPYFEMLRPRIFNWNFADWREDSPAIFAPYHQSPEQSWERFLEKVDTAHQAIRVSCSVDAGAVA